MRRHILLVVLALALLAAACGNGADASVDQPMSTPSSTVSEDSTAAPADSSTTTNDSSDSVDTTSATSSTKPEGPAAPDFTLALGASGSESLTLSEEAKPVFMIFWAEW